MEQYGQKLPIQPTVKFPNGTYVTLSYNPYMKALAQETRAANGTVINGGYFPVHNFITTAAIQEVYPQGFVQLKDRLLGIAFATVNNARDHALFFAIKDGSIRTYDHNHVATNAEILNIEMTRTSAGNLAASLLVLKEKYIGTVAIRLIGESPNFEKESCTVEDTYIKINK